MERASSKPPVRETSEREDVWLWIGASITAVGIAFAVAQLLRFRTSRSAAGQAGAPLPIAPELEPPTHRALRALSRQHPRVSVVIPALNERENLAHVLSRLPGDLHQVVLVDGGSEDGTPSVARYLFPSVEVIEQTGHGKGDALACGFAHCDGDIVVTIDADGSNDPREIPRFVDALQRGASCAKGSRFLPGGGTSDMTLTRRLGNRVLGAFVNVLFGVRYTDLCYGYNAFWRRCLPQLGVECNGFEVETLLHIRLARAGFEVVEIPSFEARRIAGRSNLNALRDGWRVLRTILAEWLSLGVGSLPGGIKAVTMQAPQGLNPAGGGARPARPRTGVS